MRKILLWIVVISWMALIFKFSSQPAVKSSKLSRKVASITIKVVKKIKPNTELNISKTDHIVRKNAHFFIYLCLGILTITALKRNGVRGLRCIAFAVLLCILYAVSDEIHQSFVSGRSTQFMDVIIDSTGAIIGILIKSKLKAKTKAKTKAKAPQG